MFEHAEQLHRMADELARGQRRRHLYTNTPQGTLALADRMVTVSARLKNDSDFGKQLVGEMLDQSAATLRTWLAAGMPLESASSGVILEDPPDRRFLVPKRMLDALGALPPRLADALAMGLSIPLVARSEGMSRCYTNDLESWLPPPAQEYEATAALRFPLRKGDRPVVRVFGADAVLGNPRLAARLIHRQRNAGVSVRLGFLVDAQEHARWIFEGTPITLRRLPRSPWEVFFVRQPRPRRAPGTKWVPNCALEDSSLLVEFVSRRLG